MGKTYITASIIIHAPAGFIDLAQMRDTIGQRISDLNSIADVTFKTRLALKSSKTNQPYVGVYQSTTPTNSPDLAIDVVVPFISIDINYSSEDDIRGIVVTNKSLFYQTIPNNVKEVVAVFFAPIIDISGVQVVTAEPMLMKCPSTCQFKSDVEVKLDDLEAGMKREIALIRSKL